MAKQPVKGKPKDLLDKLADAGKTTWLIIGYCALFCGVPAAVAAVVALFTHDWASVPRAVLWMIEYVVGMKPEYPGQR
jgi:hypothetical protein